ncbi:MAG: P-type conjugative transfer protein TrbJ [Gammaproteobacteria bacterium]
MINTLMGLSFLSTTVYAFACVNCSTFYQQMYQFAEEVNTELNTADQLIMQTNQYKNMVSQGAKLDSSIHNNISADLQRVVDVYNHSQALGRKMQNLDSKFNESFPGYQSYLRTTNQYPASNTMPDRYQKWSEQGRDNVKLAMKAADLNISTFDNEDIQLSRMVSRSHTAQGRMQAIQAGNEISAQNVQQLQKLRDLIATQINMQGNYIAQIQDRTTLDDALNQQRRSGVIIQTGNTKGY